VAGRRWSRSKQIMDDLKKWRRYWKVKEEALAGTVWRTHCGEAMDLSEDGLWNE